METLVREVRTVPCPWCDEQVRVVVQSVQERTETARARFLRYRIESIYLVDVGCEHMDDWFIPVWYEDE